MSFRISQQYVEFMAEGSIINKSVLKGRWPIWRLYKANYGVPF
jgi:hypothetical protein